MSNHTIIAFDFGTRSIGIAVGQTLTATASPLSAVKAQDGIPDWNLIEKVVNEWQPDYLVVGLPLNMDGSEQELTQRAKKFANRLHGRLGKKVELQDERLSTTEARARLFEKGGFKSLSKGRVDSQSAVIILESWFENLYS